MKRFLVAAICFTTLYAASPAFAAKIVGHLTVDPAGVARVNSPLTATFDGQLAEGNLALIPSGLSSGHANPVAVERAGKSITLRWVEPQLDADKPGTYDIIALDDAKPANAAFHFQAGEGMRDLLFGDRPIWRDMLKYDPADRANTFKPYKHVFAFDSKDEFITKGPGGLYTHHRGIFFGFKAFHGDTLLGDFWHCPDVTERHVKYLDDREFASSVIAHNASVTDWVTKEEKAVVRDTREVTTWRISPTDFVMDFQITVENLTDEAIKLGGDAHHAGFHFRAAQSVAGTKPGGSDGTATYIRSEGSALKSNDIWENESWAHVMFPINGHPYAVTHFDSPTNFRPIQYSTRPYGRVGSFFMTTVEKDKPLVLHYRLRVRSGDPAMKPEDLAREYADYSTPVKVSFN